MSLGLEHPGKRNRTPEEPDSGVDLRKYFHIVLKHKWLIGAVTLAVLGLTIAWTFTRTKIYEASATLIVENRAPQVLGNKVNEVVDLSTGSLWRNKEYMNTQENIIRSYTVAERALEELKIDKDPMFWPPGVLSGAQQEGLEPTRKDAISYLQSIIEAKTLRDSNLLQIAVRHRSPEIASALTNAIARIYASYNIDYKISTSTGASKWLADQLDELKTQLEKAELALYEFKRNNNIVSVSLEAKQTLIMSQIQKLSDALSLARINRLSLEGVRKVMREQKDVAPLNNSAAQVTKNEVIKQLKAAYHKENQALQELSAHYLAEHPKMRQQKVRVDTAMAALKKEVTNVLGSVENEHKALLTSERRLAAALQKAKEEALALNKREVTYRRLRRDQQNTEKLYSLVLSRFKESSLSSQMKFNNVRVLDAATVPEYPVSPRVHLTLIIGLMLGLLLGTGFAVLREILDVTVKSPRDIEEIDGLVNLGITPRIPGTTASTSGRRKTSPDADLVVHRQPMSTFAEHCRSIRTNLLFSSPDQQLKSLVVTSAGPREGKTTTAISLATTMAQAGSRVLLIDTDMRRPRIHKAFDIADNDGLTSLLLGDAEIDDVIKTTEIPDLLVLPCGVTPPSPAELCQSKRFKNLLEELSERFDRVILDSPPVMFVTDAALLSTIADGVLLVSRARVTNRVAFRETYRALRDVNARVVGCVLNDTTFGDKLGYGYGRYSGYYSYGYGYRAEEENAAS